MGCAGAPRRTQGGLAALQCIRQRHSLCRRCPPLFSPQATGDAPELHCLPECMAVTAQSSLVSLSSMVTPGLFLGLVAAVAYGLGSILGKHGQTDGQIAPSRAALKQPAPELWVPGKEMWGEEGEAQLEPGKSHSRGKAPFVLAITSHCHGSWIAKAAPRPT